MREKGKRGKKEKDNDERRGNDEKTEGAKRKKERKDYERKRNNERRGNDEKTERGK